MFSVAISSAMPQISWHLKNFLCKKMVKNQTVKIIVGCFFYKKVQPFTSEVFINAVKLKLFISRYLLISPNLTFLSQLPLCHLLPICANEDGLIL